MLYQTILTESYLRPTLKPKKEKTSSKKSAHILLLADKICMIGREGGTFFLSASDKICAFFFFATTPKCKTNTHQIPIKYSEKTHQILIKCSSNTLQILIPSRVKVPFAKLGSTFHWAEVWSKKSYPTDRPTIHPEKVLDLRSYFPQIFETDQHFSVDFFCKI